MANVARGAAVAIDPRTGGILAMVSRPSFDLNEFARGLSRVRWQQFMEDRTYPLLNRAIQSAYPPASTYKVITSLAGLEEGKIEPKTRMPVACGGGYRYGARFYRCWNHDGHGSLDPLRRARPVVRHVLLPAWPAWASTASPPGRRRSGSARRPGSTCRRSAPAWCRPPPGSTSTGAGQVDQGRP